MEITTVPIQYVKALLKAAVFRGLDRDKLLLEAGITSELLGNNKTRLSAATYANFSHLISEELQDEFGGFMNTPCKPGTYEMMCYACINCPTLETFLLRGIKFYGLVTDSIELELSKDDKDAQYVLSTQPGTEDPDNFLAFILLGIVHRLSSWVIDQPLILKSVSFTHSRPGTASEYNFLFKAPIKFDQADNSLNFSSSYLDMPVQQSDQTLQEFLAKPELQLMGLSSSDNSLVVKVKRLIKDKVSTEFPEFESIAEHLHSTTVTLRRRLREEGSSYQQIKDDLRRDTAIFNLGKGSMSIEQVAESVGFSEPTSFFRAFKRWTGVTPRAYVSNKPDG
jgi:AraC-like DNA-binding protein